MREQTKYLKWITPKTLKRLHHRAKDRANAGRWDLDVAVFLFSVLCIVIILLYQRVGILIVTTVAIFGLSMVWLCGFRKAKLLYRRYYDQELFEQSDEWKDLYKVLKITPSAKPEIIIEAYNRLTKAYREALSSAEKRLPLHSVLLRECDEAYQMLSDPIIKSAYDHIYWLRYNAEKDEAKIPIKENMVDLIESVAQDISHARKPVTLKALRLGKRGRKVVLATVISLFIIPFLGTSVALANPDHIVAEPFRGPAMLLLNTSAGATHLIEYVRGVVATYERNIVSTALQSMRVIEDITVIPEISISTNDMTQFPSPEYPLFPEYLDKRYSQFKYTVNSKGIIVVDTSGATTDRLLESIKDLLYRLER